MIIPRLSDLFSWKRRILRESCNQRAAHFDYQCAHSVPHTGQYTTRISRRTV